MSVRSRGDGPFSFDGGEGQWCLQVDIIEKILLTIPQESTCCVWVTPEHMVCFATVVSLQLFC